MGLDLVLCRAADGVIGMIFLEEWQVTCDEWRGLIFTTEITEVAEVRAELADRRGDQ